MTNPMTRIPDSQRPALARATSSTGSAAEVAYSALLDADSEFRKVLASIAATPYSPEDIAAGIAAFKSSEVYKAVDTTAQAAADGAAADQDAATGTRATLQDSDVAGDAASEVRALRVWDRFKQSFDNVDQGPKLFNAAQQAVINASPAELPVLLTELPSYLLVRGQQSDPTVWINALARQVSPDYASAVDNSAQSSAQSTVALGNAQAFKRAVDNTDSPFSFRAFYANPFAQTAGVQAKVAGPFPT